MKKVLLIAQLVFCFNAFSQSSNDSIVTTNKMWSQVHRYPYGLPPPQNGCAAESNYIKFAEDTLINDYRYKKIFQSKDSLGLNWVDIGFVREQDNKVYAINNEGDYERLLYDFNVEVNDTLFILPFHISDSMPAFARFGKVHKIDSIDILSGRKKRIEFDVAGGDTWIEGIGSINGITNSFWDPDGAKYDLLCCWDNGILQYSNSDFEECFILENNCTSSQTEISSENLLTIYPNPFKNRVTFKFGQPLQNHRLDIKVFDLNGKIVYTACIAENTMIDLSKLNSGMYFYSYTSIIKNLCGYGKLLKQ